MFGGGLGLLVFGALACDRGGPIPEVSLQTTSAPAPADVVRRPSGPVATNDPSPPSGYRRPPADVIQIVDAPLTPSVAVAPGGEWLTYFTRQPSPGIDIVARPFDRLAGLRIDTALGIRRRLRWLTAVELQTVADGAFHPVKLPAAAWVAYPRWSSDGQSLAMALRGDDGLELWVASRSGGEAHRVGSFTINDVLGTPFVWMPDSKSLLVRQVPSARGPAPAEPTVPVGPVVADTAGRTATNRTYQDLLRSASDEARFEYFATSQLAVTTLDGQARPLGEPDLVMAVDPSPDGNFVRVNRLRRPFSYTVPYYRFALVIEVLDTKAKVVRRVADLDVAEEIPIEGVRTGPRAVHWQPWKSATLVWSEALDGGDPRQAVDHRDRLMSQAAPFADTPEEQLRVKHRLVDVSWTSNSGQVLVEEYDRDRRWLTEWLYELDTPASSPRILFDRSSRDAYADPGDPVTERTPDGSTVVRVVQGWMYLAGDGASPQGDRPFFDRYELATGKTERLMHSEGDSHTEFIDFVGSQRVGWLVRRESPTKPPNFWVMGQGPERPLTTFPDPHPQLTGIRKQVLRYRRGDGVPLSGTLYLPPSYEVGQSLPLVVWAYPLEYNDRDTAGQVRAAPRTFTRLYGTSPLMFLTQGYAVLAGAAMPVVGDPETMNDTLIEQLVDAAEATVDAVVATGAVDRERIGIAGHSYGAFMAANLLAHSDLFCAGLARSGAYNRSLTPFGFQSERRTLWEAPQTYVQVSPLFAADRINEPLLLIHGAQDNNSGTFPLQSQRLFHALSGTGGIARLVMLPEESHGYVARESVLHVLAESFDWFDTHVKNAEPKPAARPRGGSARSTSGAEPADSESAPPGVSL